MIYIGSPVLAWTTVLGRRKFQWGIRQKECLNCSRAQYHSRKYISVEPKYDTPVCWLYSLDHWTGIYHMTRKFLWGVGNEMSELHLTWADTEGILCRWLTENYPAIVFSCIDYCSLATQCGCHGISFSPLPVQHYHCLTVSVIQATIYTTCTCGGTLLTQASEMNPLR